MVYFVYTNGTKTLAPQTSAVRVYPEIRLNVHWLAQQVINKKNIYLVKVTDTNIPSDLKKVSSIYFILFRATNFRYRMY